MGFEDRVARQREALAAEAARKAAQTDLEVSKRREGIETNTEYQLIMEAARNGELQESLKAIVLAEAKNSSGVVQITIKDEMILNGDEIFGSVIVEVEVEGENLEGNLIPVRRHVVIGWHNEDYVPCNGHQVIHPKVGGDRDGHWEIKYKKGLNITYHEYGVPTFQSVEAVLDFLARKVAIIRNFHC